MSVLSQAISIAHSKPTGQPLLRSFLSSSKKEEIVLLSIRQRSAGKMMQFDCRLTEGYEYLTPLLRGLLNLGKPRGMEISFQNNQDLFVFSFPTKQKKSVDAFLGNLELLIQKEVNFKQILKALISNQKKFNAEQRLIEAALRSS